MRDDIEEVVLISTLRGVQHMLLLQMRMEKQMSDLSDGLTALFDRVNVLVQTLEAGQPTPEQQSAVDDVKGALSAIAAENSTLDNLTGASIPTDAIPGTNDPNANAAANNSTAGSDTSSTPDTSTPDTSTDTSATGSVPTTTVDPGTDTPVDQPDATDPAVQAASDTNADSSPTDPSANPANPSSDPFAG